MSNKVAIHSDPSSPLTPKQRRTGSIESLQNTLTTKKRVSIKPINTNKQINQFLKANNSFRFSNSLQSQSPLPTDPDEFTRIDDMPFPKFNPNDPNLAHLSPTGKDRVRRDNIMNWVREVSGKSSLDVDYKGADYWQDLRYQEVSLWRVIIEPLLENQGRVEEFQESIIQAKSVRKLFEKEQIKLEKKRKAEAYLRTGKQQTLSPSFRPQKLTSNKFGSGMNFDDTTYFDDKTQTNPEGLLRLQKMGYCRTFKPPKITESLPKIPVKDEEQVVEKTESLNQILSTKLMFLNHGPMNEYGLLHENQDELKARVKQIGVRQKKIGNAFTEQRLCRITPFNKTLEQIDQKPAKNAPKDRLPKYKLLIDALQDLAVEMMQQESFVEMLKNWQKQRKAKPPQGPSGRERLRIHLLNEQLPEGAPKQIAGHVSSNLNPDKYSRTIKLDNFDPAASAVSFGNDSTIQRESEISIQPVPGKNQPYAEIEDSIVSMNTEEAQRSAMNFEKQSALIYAQQQNNMLNDPSEVTQSQFEMPIDDVNSSKKSWEYMPKTDQRPTNQESFDSLAAAEESFGKIEIKATKLKNPKDLAEIQKRKNEYQKQKLITDKKEKKKKKVSAQVHTYLMNMMPSQQTTMPTQISNHVNDKSHQNDKTEEKVDDKSVTFFKSDESGYIFCNNSDQIGGGGYIDDESIASSQKSIVEGYTKLPKKVKTFLGTYVRNKMAVTLDSAQDEKSSMRDESPMRMNEIDSNDQHSVHSQMQKIHGLEHVKAFKQFQMSPQNSVFNQLEQHLQGRSHANLWEREKVLEKAHSNFPSPQEIQEMAVFKQEGFMERPIPINHTISKAELASKPFMKKFQEKCSFTQKLLEKCETNRAISTSIYNHSTSVGGMDHKPSIPDNMMSPKAWNASNNIRADCQNMMSDATLQNGPTILQGIARGKVKRMGKKKRHSCLPVDPTVKNFFKVQKEEKPKMSGVPSYGMLSQTINFNSRRQSHQPLPLLNKNSSTDMQQIVDLRPQEGQMPQNQDYSIGAYRPFEEIPSVELNTQSGDRTDMESIGKSVASPMNTGVGKAQGIIKINKKSTMPKSMQKRLEESLNKSMRTVTSETEPAHLSANVVQSTNQKSSEQRSSNNYNTIQVTGNATSDKVQSIIMPQNSQETFKSVSQPESESEAAVSNEQVTKLPDIESKGLVRESPIQDDNLSRNHRRQTKTLSIPDKPVHKSKYAAVTGKFLKKAVDQARINKQNTLPYENQLATERTNNPSPLWHSYKPAHTPTRQALQQPLKSRKDDL